MTEYLLHSEAKKIMETIDLARMNDETEKGRNMEWGYPSSV